MISDRSNYIAVVAIDFGTTYSGFAFAFNQHEGEGGIHMNRSWGHDQGHSTLKTPTSLLLRPDGQFDSFGYEADEKYANFVCGEDHVLRNVAKNSFLLAAKFFVAFVPVNFSVMVYFIFL